MGVQKKKFGVTKDGKTVTLYTVTNKNGMSLSAIDYGANLVSLMVPDKNGNIDDIVLGYDDVAGYEKNGCFFGAMIGRHGNRIGQARFTLNGKEYQLEENDGVNNLHSGSNGYHKLMFEASATEDSVTFSRISPHMEQGFPGELHVSVTYTLTDDNEWKLTYRAKSDQDTLCNMTNHSYFNLKGHDGGPVTDHAVWIKANGFTETSDDLIPNGNITEVAGTPLDFREKKLLGRDIDADYKPLKQGGGYDHNFVLDKEDGVFAKVAEISEESSGRTMEVYTDLPGMQMYSGNFVKNEHGKNGVVYTERTGVCFETQFFPNSINIPGFKPCILKAGEDFQSVTVYKFV